MGRGKYAFGTRREISWVYRKRDPVNYRRATSAGDCFMPVQCWAPEFSAYRVAHARAVIPSRYTPGKSRLSLVIPVQLTPPALTACAPHHTVGKNRKNARTSTGKSRGWLEISARTGDTLMQKRRTFLET